MTPETQLRLQPHALPLLSTASWHSLLPCPTTPRQASQGRWPLGCDSKSLDLALYSIVRFGVRQKHKTPSSQSPILYLNYLLATCPAHVLQPNSQTHRNTHCFWEPATHQHSVCSVILAEPPSLAPGVLLAVSLQRRLDFKQVGFKIGD